MCDGEKAYAIFTVTAPEDVDLESNLTASVDGPVIIPGNSGLAAEGKPSFLTSEGIFYEEGNAIWQCTCGWEADNDGKANTLNYMFSFWCETLDTTQARMLTDPFASGFEFYFHFENFVRFCRDEEYCAELEKKYAGQEAYMIDGEEAARMYKTDLLVEGTWDFTLTFDGKSQQESVELISEPVTVEADVHRRVGNEPLFYDTSNKLEPVKLTSFRLTPLGVTLCFEQEADVLGAFFEWKHYYGHEDRYIYAVMKDGRQVALHTDSVGTILTAESPIVLDSVDHILMGDGAILPMPE